MIGSSFCFPVKEFKIEEDGALISLELDISKMDSDYNTGESKKGQRVGRIWVKIEWRTLGFAISSQMCTCTCICFIVHVFVYPQAAATAPS